jgi:hypothetical protein
MATRPDDAQQAHGGGHLERSNPNPRLRRLVGRDGVQPAWMAPLTEPRWLAGAAAEAQMRPGDAVLGLAFEGGAWALPWWIMKNHHVANLTLAGRPVVATLCEVCSSAAAHDPVIDGRPHRFRLAGIYNGTIMPADDETGSYWTGFTGESIDGPLKGRRIARRPLWQATWEEWRREHPGTLVADGAGEPRDGHGEGQTPGSPVVGQGMRPLLAHVDLRLPHHVLVLGVEAGGAARCYPLRALERAALNDELGGVPLAVLARPGSWMALAFDRRVEGRALTFRDADGRIEDAETGGRWSLAGECLEGPLRGRRLRYLTSGIEEFFIWAAFHPETTIHGAAPPPARMWSGDGLHDPVHRAMSTWWPRGAKLLHTGCGGGMISAWMAERGFEVHAVDADAAKIAAARRDFRGAPRLSFAAADLAAPAALPAGFGAALDDGLFASLDARGRAAYADNLAAACAPGAMFLLLLPGAGSARFGALRPEVQSVFEPRFRVFGLSELPIALPGGERMAPGASFRLERRAAAP